MNALVIAILAVALAIQLVALILAAGDQIKIDDDGNPWIDYSPRRRKAAGVLTIIGLIVATAGGLVSLWAPGFH